MVYSRFLSLNSVKILTNTDDVFALVRSLPGIVATALATFNRVD